jgi:hypothetical protein
MLEGVYRDNDMLFFEDILPSSPPFDPLIILSDFVLERLNVSLLLFGRTINRLVLIAQEISQEFLKEERRMDEHIL